MKSSASHRRYRWRKRRSIGLHPFLEVALKIGRIVRVDEEFEPVRLARLVTALDGTPSRSRFRPVCVSTWLQAAGERAFRVAYHQRRCGHAHPGTAVDVA